MQKTVWAFLICCILASCSIVSMSNESQRLGLDVGSGEVSDNKEAEGQDEDIILSSAVIATIVKKSGEYKVEKNIFGDTEIRSRGGSKTTIEKDIFGNTIIRDSDGNKITVEKDIFGNTVVKDNRGNKTTIEKDIFGDTIIKDNKGNKTTVEKDMFGNIIIKSN